MSCQQKTLAVCPHSGFCNKSRQLQIIQRIAAADVNQLLLVIFFLFKKTVESEYSSCITNFQKEKLLTERKWIMANTCRTFILLY